MGKYGFGRGMTMHHCCAILGAVFPTDFAGNSYKTGLPTKQYRFSESVGLSVKASPLGGHIQ
jgi:hypothetical protein